MRPIDGLRTGVCQRFGAGGPLAVLAFNKMMGAAMGLVDSKGFAVDGKSRPRIRRQRKPAVSAAQRKRFLEALAETCNVLLSAEQAGFRPQRAYDLKARDATFRAGWDQALAAGYAQLELMMLERALHGEEKVIRLPGGESATMREYSDRVGLTLLKMHREGASMAGDPIDGAEQEEACERIMARLDRLRARDIEEVETKGAKDRLGLIDWALAKACLDR